MSESQPIITREPQPAIELGNLRLSYGDYRVHVNHRPIDLSVHEFEVLAALMRQADRVLSYAVLATEVWQHADRRHIRHLNVLIHRLRQKLEGCTGFSIQTVRGRGYGFLSTHLDGTASRAPEPAPAHS